MFLYVVRHAWAEERGDPAWPDDRQRPLTPEGRTRFARLVKKLVARGFAPAVIATSPLVRCRQTAELLAERVLGKPTVVDRDELAPDSNLAGLIEWTAGQAQDQDVAWVGHAPDVGDIVAALIGGPTAAVELSKGAVAAIRFRGTPQLRQGELRWLVTAKILGIEK